MLDQDHTNPTLIRRLDHVAVVVSDTAAALAFFRDRLGLQVVSSEEVGSAGVRLTYLDCGNAFLQLVEPIASGTEFSQFLEANGEGLHHLCFGVEDVVSAVHHFARGAASELRLGRGRGRRSAFLPGDLLHGTRVECTELSVRDDVASTSPLVT